MYSDTLPKYFPIERGEYSVAPGLKPLGHDFGNPEFDAKVFHITKNFSIYRKNKIEARAERLSKYFCTHDLSPEREKTLATFLVGKFTEEYPQIFERQDNTLFCRHTHDQIIFDENFNLIEMKNDHEEFLPIVSNIIDALALQIEEDIALVCRTVNGETTRDHLGLLHLTSPSHWAAEDKIGMNFFDIHVPIPGIERINKVADKLVETMISKGPFVRFIWSFVTDERLNHHPTAPEGIDSVVWKGRSFNNEAVVPFHFRIERQVTWGFPEVDASLFTIGVSFMSGSEVKNDPYFRSQLISALHSMTPESRVYKGVSGCFDQLIGWLTK
jgi:hypothetical protein